jgi:hypothetical protein
LADTTLVDPLGRTIVLHDHTWHGHVVKGHPEVRTERRRAEDAVWNPAEICFSTSDPDCRIYYGVASSAGLIIAVVADVVAGFVKTVYRTNRTKGVREWP